VRCLSEFAFRGVNLTKIESRPLRMRLGHYRFFVDCEGGAHEPSVAEAVDGLRKHCEQVRILGSYPVAGAPE
jgi:prephenate dehydratase